MMFRILLLACLVSLADCCGRRGGGRSQPPPDRTRPSLVCPATIGPRVRADRGQTSKFCTWEVPVASDDRDTNVAVRRSGPAPNTRLHGENTIRYSASDNSGNTETCSFDINVEVVYCTPPPEIDNGYFIYHPGADWRYGGMAQYGCYRGFNLDGTSRLTCELAAEFSAVWDAVAPSCERVTCPLLVQISRASQVCTDLNRYESRCTFTCDDGYDVAPGVGRSLVCSWRGSWLGSVPTCLDVQRPVWISCPTSRIYYLNRNSNFSSPAWLRPTVIDNSGEDIEVILTSGFDTGESAGVGTYQVTYEAIDSAGNSARPCSFTINIRAVRCPRIYPTPNLFVSCPGGYDWGDECTFSCEYGYNLAGLSTSSCEAPGTPPLPQWSFQLNMPSCDGAVCPPLEAPENGALVCDLWLYGDVCRQFCDDRYDVFRGHRTDAQDLFICGHDTGQWNHPVRDCTYTANPSRYRMPLEVNYFSGDCCDSAVQEELQRRFIEILLGTPVFSSLCSNHLEECRFDNTRVVCGPACNVTEGPSIRKRDTSALNDTQEYTLQISGTIVIPAMADSYGLDSYIAIRDSLDDVLQDIRLQGILNDLEIEGVATSLQSIEQGSVEVQCDEGYFPTNVGNCVGCERGQYYDSESEDCEPCPRGTYHNEGSVPACEPCPAGQSTARVGARSADECERACPIGTFSSTGVGVCSPCMPGTYAASIGSLFCDDCPAGTTTADIGATRITQCQTFSIDVLGYEDTSYAQVSRTSVFLETIALSFKIMLEALQGNSSTLVTVSTDVAILFKANGIDSLEVVIDGCLQAHTELKADNWNTVYWARTSSESYELFVNNEEILNLSDCLEAPMEGNITANIGGEYVGKVTDFNIWGEALTSENIESIHTECLPQLSGNIVSWNDFKDAELLSAIIETPSQCDVADQCSDNACGAHECVDGSSSYTCICNAGFTGQHCETDIDDCVQHSCEEGSTCQDSEDDYVCVCPEEMRGRYCEQEIVHGGWSEWGEYSDCSVSCAGGEQQRNRTCTQPVPGPDGQDCAGDSIDIQSCNEQECPVCAQLTPPPHSTLNCHINETDYKNCTLECDTGYAYSIEPLPYYLCDAETTFFTWNFQTETNPNGQLPECTEIVEASALVSDHTASYADMQCTDRNINEHSHVVTRNMESVRCVQRGICTWSMEVHNCNDRDRNRRSPDPISFDLYIRINQSHIPTGLTSQEIIPVYDPLVNELIEAATTAYYLIDNGNFTVTVEDDVYYIDGHQINPVIECPYAGMIYDDFYCIPCERGTYEENLGCYLCEVGSYQNETGQTHCYQCPRGYSTEGEGSRSIEDCTVSIDIIDPGSGSKKTANDDVPVIISAVVAGMVFLIGAVIAVIVVWKCKAKRDVRLPEGSNVMPEKNSAYIADEEDIKYHRDSTAPMTHKVDARILRAKSGVGNRAMLSKQHLTTMEDARNTPTRTKIHVGESLDTSRPASAQSISLGMASRPNTARGIGLYEESNERNNKSPVTEVSG